MSIYFFVWRKVIYINLKNLNKLLKKDNIYLEKIEDFQNKNINMQYFILEKILSYNDNEKLNFNSKEIISLTLLNKKLLTIKTKWFNGIFLSYIFAKNESEKLNFSADDIIFLIKEDEKQLNIYDCYDWNIFMVSLLGKINFSIEQFIYMYEKTEKIKLHQAIKNNEDYIDLQKAYNNFLVKKEQFEIATSIKNIKKINNHVIKI